MSSHPLQKLADTIRASCPDPAPNANPLVDMWRHEFDGAVKIRLRSMAIECVGPDMLIEGAARALGAGCTPSVVAEALEACIPFCEA